MPRKSVPLRIDPAVYNAIAAWANQEMRPKDTGEIPKRGRPKNPKSTT